MGLFNAYVASDSASFPFEDWIKAPTSGQPTPISIGKIYVASGQGYAAEPIDADRFIAFFRADNTNQYPSAVIVDKSGTPSAGSVATIKAVTAQIMFRRRVPFTNMWIVGTDNDLYLLDCGSSGSTITVTQLSSNAGDAGKGEGFVRHITDIIIEEDASCFVIVNEFNNGGTRAFVSALWTLSLSGTPAATYVTRDVDNSGGTVASTTGSGYYISSGVGLYTACSEVDANSVFVNKVSFTTTTVANSVSTLTVAQAISGSTQESGSRMYSRMPAFVDLVPFAYIQANNVFRMIWIDTSAAPALYAEPSSSFTTVLSDNYYPHDFNVICHSLSQGGTALVVQNRFTQVVSRPLITGLTSLGTFAYSYSLDYNWACVLGKQNTDDGYIFLMKNAAV